MTHDRQGLFFAALVLAGLVNVTVDAAGTGNQDILWQAFLISITTSIIASAVTVFLIFFIKRRCDRKSARTRCPSDPSVPSTNKPLLSNGAEGRAPNEGYPPPGITRSASRDLTSRRIMNDYVSDWCTKNKLTEETARQLRANKFIHPEEIEAMDIEDITHLEITGGQRALLKAIITRRKEAEKQKEREQDTSFSSPRSPMDSSFKSRTPSVQSRRPEFTSQPSRTSTVSSASPYTPPAGESLQLMTHEGGAQSRFRYPSIPQPSMQIPELPEEKFHGHLSTNGLCELAKRIGQEYRQLATFLGISQKQLEQIHRDHHSSVDQNFYILITWRDWSLQRGKDEALIKGKLVKALERCGRRDLANEIMREDVHGSNTNISTGHSIV